jgi:hypothetical protein
LVKFLLSIASASEIRIPDEASKIYSACSYFVPKENNQNA